MHVSLDLYSAEQLCNEMHLSLLPFILIHGALYGHPSLGETLYPTAGPDSRFSASSGTYSLNRYVPYQLWQPQLLHRLIVTDIGSILRPSLRHLRPTHGLLLSRSIHHQSQEHSIRTCSLLPLNQYRSPQPLGRLAPPHP